MVTVAGTNGKGSCVAMLEAALGRGGARTGAYFSPALGTILETVRVGGRDCTPEALCQAYEAVETARASTTLTEFEFQTLGAVECFRDAGVDVAVLEIGMGGLHDAVNVIEPSVTLITNVAIDHRGWLGDTREQIGVKKAGIMRPGVPVVIGESGPPASVMLHAERLEAPVYRLGVDFGYQLGERSWSWWGDTHRVEGLGRPLEWPDCQFDNAAAALMTLSLVPESLRGRLSEIASTVVGVTLPGRLQVVRGSVERVFDVAHNLAASQALHRTLLAQPVKGRTLGVFAMLGDKDVEAVVALMGPLIDRWHVGGLRGPRGISAASLVARMSAVRDPVEVVMHECISTAYRTALSAASPGDRVVVWGSFHTVAAAIRVESTRRHGEN